MVRPGRETELVVRRFRYEREILAGLDHPNIAALYDGGVNDDHYPYFAMEFVEGQRMDDSARTALPIRERLELFSHVAPPCSTPTATSWSIATSSRATSWSRPTAW